MALRTSALGILLIKQFEGLRLDAYLCPAGVLTIGYGHTSMAGAPVVKRGMRISATEAEHILARDIDRFEDGVERLLPKGVPLRPCQFDALVSLAFNIGIGAFGKSTLLKKIKAGKLEDVPAQFMRWNKVDGKPVAGLTRRRRAETALWRGFTDEAKDASEKLESTPMPQRVDEPKPPKTIAQSTEAAGAVAGGLAGTIAAGKAIGDTVTELAKSASTWTQTLLAVSPWVLLAVVIALAAGYVVYARRKRLIEDHV